MEDSFKQSVKDILADRPYLFLCAATMAAALVYALYAFFTIEPRDIQVISQYSAFGEAQFYKEKWYYMYTFVGFGVVTALINTALMAKLHSLEKRDFGIVLGWVSLIIILIAFRYTYEVMHFAFL